ncbi:MAG: hypothetical protein ACKOTZ_09185 [Chloroflexota bacterium]
MSEVIIQKRFVPRVGEGKNLRVALRDMSAALVANGFPEMEIWAPVHGGHNVLVTVERYATMAAWDEYNATATSYPTLVSGVFDGIYPTTITPYDTEILRLVDKREIR